MKSEKELEKKKDLHRFIVINNIGNDYSGEFDYYDILEIAEYVEKRAKQDERERLWNKIKDRKILCNYDECEICSFLRELFKEYGVE